jgi:gas vesicle protein
MYYEDQSRRFNLLSGLLFGTVIGTGIALLAGPIRSIELPRRRPNRRKQLQKELDRLSRETRKVVGSTVDTAARRLRQ